jgi:site-specific DNA-cytosine methylase
VIKAGRDVSYALDASYHKGTNTTMKSRRQLVLEQHTVAYSKSTRETHIDVRGKVNGEANTLSTGDGCGNMSTQNFVSTTDVRIRKLTPVECERLQSWPSGHTELGRKPDGSIYNKSNTQRNKNLGN